MCSKACSKKMANVPILVICKHLINKHVPYVPLLRARARVYVCFYKHCFFIFVKKYFRKFRYRAAELMEHMEHSIKSIV